MLRLNVTLPLLLCSMFCVAQTATEVYLFDFDRKFQLSEPVNISNNPGKYDNQPFFPDDRMIYFTATRDGQTDVRTYNFFNERHFWLTDTKANEYSPQLTPSDHTLTAVKLEKDGAQGLFEYKRKRIHVEPWELIKGIKVGYYVWANRNTIVSFALEDEGSSLMVSKLRKKTNTPVAKNIGRSLHVIPGTDLISYISKEKDHWEIRSLNPKNGQTNFIIHTLEGSEDMCWTSKGVILMTKGTELFKFDPKSKDQKGWVKFADLKDFGLGEATRIALSPKGKKLAVVVAEKE
ncbi:TolB family protein [Sungkyunkwania multivorans]|uniref:TolB family protein n=1 Tax=Sungkyunkwania multivorans TaxID=1173618 RepID=A0ABW3CW59_9FLAO